MSDQTNHLSIYLIVFLNAATHVMLIWRLKLDKLAKWKFCALTLALPLLIMVAMRLMVGVGLIQGRVAEQGGLERFITALASMLLIAGPFLVTGAAVFFRRKQKALLAQQDTLLAEQSPI
jgi:ribose/xylose/arabinose/galactoside ABC-type transport system permease subunit